MYAVWNFHLSLSHHEGLIFCWIDNGIAVVAQSLTVSLVKNPIEYLLLTEFEGRTVSYGPSFFPRFMAQARGP